MTRDINNLRCLVTGASSGIGKAIAAALAEQGAVVFAVGRSVDKLAALKAEQPKIHLITGDITLAADRERIIREASGGGLDVLVNVAGIAAWGHFQTSTEEINRKILETNFFAPVELTRLAVPTLMKGRQPAVVNLTSMCARRGMPAWPEYSASKFALAGLTESLRGELVRFGIDTLHVVPGLTKTNLQTNMLRNDGRVPIPYETGMDPKDVATAVATAIRTNATETILGGEAKKILRLNKWAPRLLNKLIGKRVTREYQ